MLSTKTKKTRNIINKTTNQTEKNKQLERKNIHTYTTRQQLPTLLIKNLTTHKNSNKKTPQYFIISKHPTPQKTTFFKSIQKSNGNITHLKKKTNKK